MTGKEILEKVGQMVLKPDGRYPGDPGFLINSPELQDIYKKIYAYMLNPTESVALGLKPHKSLMFAGSVGNGKTLCMRVMQYMALCIKGLDSRRMMIVEVNQFLKLYKEDPTLAMADFGYDKKVEMCIDDLGWEAATRFHYGNDTCVFIANLITERHRLFIDTGIRTHFTTNLKFKEDEPGAGISKPPDLTELYGLRVIDRLREMINVINWNGRSLRV